MTKSKGIFGPRAVWTAEQLEQLRTLYPDMPTAEIAKQLGHHVEHVYRKAHRLGLTKSKAYLASPTAGRLDGVRGGACRFVKGQTSWNKGLKGLNMGESETRFKAGAAPHNTLPIGSLKYDKSGTLLRKVSEAKGNNSKRWRGVHELVWTAVNGPLPPKHIVVFKPGMRTNVLEEITIDKVECITLAENMKRNTVHNMPRELVDLVRLRAVLSRSINKKEKSNVTAEID